MKALAIHQVEITSRCNLACVYCTNPTLGRPKMDMEADVFDRVMWHVRRTAPAHQPELNLAGIGEPTLHPLFHEFLRLASHAAPKSRRLITTNGLKFDEECAESCKKYGFSVFVSLHRPEKAAAAVQLCRERGILAGVSVDPTMSSIDWAGQVDWPVTAPGGDCTWYAHSRVMAMADGRVTRCCLDSDGRGVLGTVWDDGWEWSPYDLCKACVYNRNIPDEGD